MKSGSNRRSGFTLPVALEGLSLGGWIILLIAIVSTIAVATRVVPKREGLEFWVFAKIHHVLYS